MRMVAAAVMRTPITRMRLRVEFVADADDRAMGLKDIDELERIADSAILVSPHYYHETARAPATTGKGVLVGVRLQQPDLASIDAWRSHQDDRPIRAEALRRLAKKGLSAPK